MKRLIQIILFSSISFFAYSQSYIKLKLDPNHDPTEENKIEFGFIYDNQYTSQLTKGSYFEKIMTRKFIKKVDMRINGELYDSTLRHLILTPEMFNNTKSEAVITYRHPKTQNISGSDTIRLKTINYITYYTQNVKYCETLSKTFIVYFTDGTSKHINEKNRKLFDTFYHLKISAKYTSQNYIDSTSIQDTIELRPTFQTKNFDGVKNECILFSIDAPNFHQEIFVPFSSSSSYSYDFSRKKGKYESNGESGQNVQVYISHFEDDDFIVKITAQNGTTHSILLNGKNGHLAINAKGEDGKSGRNGSRGSDATSSRVGTSYIRGQDGGNGEHGGNGGNGGHVTITCPQSFKDYISHIIIYNNGGIGGQGGYGGKGGYNQFATEADWKRARFTDMARGRDGSDGYNGQNGQNGMVNFEFHD
jgi:hypothetical protein